MLIAEESRDSHLLPLLYARAAWKLGGRSDVPAPLVHPPAVGQHPPGIEHDALAGLWQHDWEAVIAAHALAPIPIELDEADAAPTMLAWLSMLPTAWDDRFAASWNHADYEDWVERVAPVPPATEYPDPVVPALVAAWRRGLRTVTVLPIADAYAEAVGTHEILLSRPTRDDPEELSRALTAWANTR